MTALNAWTRPLLLLVVVTSLMLPDDVLRVKQSLFVTGLAGMLLWHLMGLGKPDEVDDDA